MQWSGTVIYLVLYIKVFLQVGKIIQGGPHSILRFMLIVHIAYSVSTIYLEYLTDQKLKESDDKDLFHLNQIKVSIIYFFTSIMFISFIYFYGIFQLVSIQINYQHEPIKKIIGMIKRIQRLIKCSSASIALFIVINFTRNMIYVYKDDIIVSSSFKIANMVKVAFYIFTFTLMIYLEYRVVTVSFKFIKFLNYRYQLNTIIIKFVLFAIFIPFFVVALLMIFLESLWSYYLWTVKSCSEYYRDITTLNYFLLLYCILSSSLLILWVVWYLALDKSLQEDEDIE